MSKFADVRDVEFVESLKLLGVELFETAVKKGWYECKSHLVSAVQIIDGRPQSVACPHCEPYVMPDGSKRMLAKRNVGELIALFHSELSEAFEDHRNRKDFKEIHFQEDGKPDGFPIELADVVIRIIETCENMRIDLGKAILLKHEFNKNRPFRHGGKTC